MEERFVKLSVQGRLSLTTDDGQQITPKAQKERGLLALLALTEGHSHSRAWICQKLWSDRNEAQGLASLRRALCNIRQIAGDHSDFIVGSRYEICLADNVEVVIGKASDEDCALLEDLVVRDPEFDAWLNHVRGGGTEAPARQPAVPRYNIAEPEIRLSEHEQLIDIQLIEVLRPTTSEETFVQSLLIDGLASRFSTLGDGLRITRRQAADPPGVSSAGTIEVSVESLIADNGWRVNVRAIRGTSRAFIWSGFLSIDLDFEKICNGPQMGTFITQAISGIIARYRREPDRAPNQFFQLQSASSRLFSGLKADIVRGQEELNQLPSSGVALAWRGFGKLTETIEFADQNSDTVGEALQLAQESVATASENPVVLALAAQVQMKLSDDPEYGVYLADQAYQLCQHDPYALLARSQARLFQSDAEASRTAAHWARECASTLTHSYWWDMQSALSEVGVGNLHEALSLAKQTHLKMPTYRPALRYLVALSLLNNDKPAIEKFSGLLRKVETSFELSDLFKPDYPVQTLRMTGLLNSIEVS